MNNKLKFSFAQRYTQEYSNIYYERHKKGILKRFSNILEQNMAAKVLKMAGYPKSVLDLPCGAGRFLQTILNTGCERTLAGDNSPGMLQVIKDKFPSAILEKLELLELDLVDIHLPDKSVDSILCMRFMHHIREPHHRIAIYKELQRVARDTVCISNWAEGNYKSYRERLRAKRKGVASRCLNSAQLEKEFDDAGFTIVGKIDMLPRILYWCTYVLKVD
ncbi:MAG: methyltransferase type 11 [Gammaproteobacteria bacterium]|jgi:ubiquinone/menaquinone biosynthesis C-methylase UbiE|nr:methyltransferase type 11 [Gammaproteobacteria bacterium]